MCAQLLEKNGFTIVANAFGTGMIIVKRSFYEVINYHEDKK